MKNIKILTFWIGEENIKQGICDKFLRLTTRYKNLDFEIGPSNTDHDFLINNFELYKNSFENRNYAACSDVWRFWKASTVDNCIYIDSMTKINEERFKEIIELTYENEFIFLYESKFYFLSGFFYSKNKENIIFKNILKFYKNNPNDVKRSPGPRVLSKFIYKKFSYRLGYNGKKSVRTLHPKEFLNSNENSIFKYNGDSSWKKADKSDVLEYFEKESKDFETFENMQIVAFKRLLIFYIKWNFPKLYKFLIDIK
ncbi:MAG: hypothetical protein ACRC4L_02580 [Mycoplasma sp.]